MTGPPTKRKLSSGCVRCSWPKTSAFLSAREGTSGIPSEPTFLGDAFVRLGGVLDPILLFVAFGRKQLHDLKSAHGNKSPWCDISGDKARVNSCHGRFCVCSYAVIKRSYVRCRILFRTNR